MKPFLAVLGREIAERKLLFVGAAFASLFPIVVPWLPGVSHQDPADLRGGTALGLALIASALLALVLGTTVIARDLSERRIGFYFARPVPGWALWAGKMLSAALLSLGVGALILLVSFLAGGRIDPTGSWGPVSGRVGGMSSLFIYFLYVALGILVLLATSHAVSVMVRSRSPWLAVDLVAFGLVVTAFWTRNGLLRQEGAFEVLAWGQLGFAVLSLLALLLAGLVQVVGGRTDLRRGHRLLSLTLWSLLGAVTLGHAAYAHWALQVSPDDLVSVQEALPAPAGSWIAVTGKVRGRGGYAPTFLLDSGSERFIKLPGQVSPWWAPPLFSLDGGRAFWFEPIGGNAEQLSVIDLRSPKPALRRTGLVYSGDFGVEPSPDGRLLAALMKGRLTVDDLENRRMLASVPLEGRAFVFFLEPGRVRILRTSQEDEPGMPKVWRLTTLDLDVAGNRLLPVSRIELPGDRWFWDISPDLRRAILRQPDRRDGLVADLETGRTTSIPGEGSAWRFLADGRMIRLRWDGGRYALSLLTRDGVERLHVPLPESRFRIGSNVSPDLLVLATTERGSYQEIKSWTSWLLDLRTGRLQKIGSGMIPAADYARTGSPSSRLFFRDPGGLALFDPETGQVRILLEGKPIEPGLWLARPRVTRLPQR